MTTRLTPKMMAQDLPHPSRKRRKMFCNYHKWSPEYHPQDPVHLDADNLTTKAHLPVLIHTHEFSELSAGKNTSIPCIHALEKTRRPNLLMWSIYLSNSVVRS
ncbi:hypothetical protein YC2023_091599 [Brassica napus]